MEERAAQSGSVLVVDDDPNIRALLAELIADERHQVRTAADGEEGLRQLAEGPEPCLVLCDLMMPRLDGFGFVDALRRMGSAVPVVAISAVRPGTHAREELGVEILDKPFNVDDVVSWLRIYCRGHGHKHAATVAQAA